MITFAESHVDLMGNITFTPQQLQRRWGQELLKKWRKEVQDNLRDFMQIKSVLNAETFPNYAENDALLSAFIADKQIIYSRRVADEAKNELLISTLAYEQAVIDISRLTLQLEGREGIADVLDPETQEIIIPAIEAVIPMSENEEGYQATVDLLAEAEAIITGASQEVINLVAERAA